MKVIIYTGLSISYEDAKKILDSTDKNEIIYKAPIKRGDILNDLKENPDIIGIIDGFFHSSPAVAHREILDVIKKGIKVFGASSMGALRASELDSLGMIGIAYVYNQYRKGIIQSDDDVAVAIDPDTLEQLSIPLVSLDYSLNKAILSGIISNEEKEEIIKIAKSIYYPNRNYNTIFKKTSLSLKKKEELIEFLKESEDIKKVDAKDLLKYIKKMIE